MALVPLIGAIYPRSRGNLQIWTIGGCLASAIALLCLAAAAVVGPSWPLRETVFMLGVTNGAYAVAAIGSMMALVGAGGEKREGVRMGLWGAAQAFAFGIGGFLGTLASDIARYLLTSPALSYSVVFASEAGLFVVAALHGGLGSSRAGAKRDATAVRRAICASPSREERRCMTHFRDLRCRGGRRRTVRRDRGARSCQSRAHGAAARPGRPHQAMRRRDSAAADPRFRHSRSSAGGARQFGAHGVAVGQAGRHADRRRLCRHGRPRCVRRVAARARRGGRREAANRTVQALRARRSRQDHRVLRGARRPTARRWKKPFVPAR